jgi:hypothetical protein
MVSAANTCLVRHIVTSLDQTRAPEGRQVQDFPTCSDYAEEQTLAPAHREPWEIELPA